MELNAERKEMTRQGEEAAHAYLESTGYVHDKVLVVFLPDCHESIAGIIAGRIRECYNKPVFVITKTKEGLKGSGRSIETYHMYNEMVRVKDCFTKFGGHPMAAGLSMEEDRLSEFRERINANAQLTEDDFVKKVHIDIALPVSWLSEEFLTELDTLEPFGNGKSEAAVCAERFCHHRDPCPREYRTMSQVISEGCRRLWHGGHLFRRHQSVFSGYGDCLRQRADRTAAAGTVFAGADGCHLLPGDQ